MNEYSPDRKLFEPSERYKQNVDILLKHIFEAPQVTDISKGRLELPDDVRYRVWDKGSALFVGICFDLDHKPVTDKDTYRFEAIVMGINPDVDTSDLFEVKTYFYRRDTGVLQSIGSVMTEEEISTLQYDPGKPSPFHQGLVEGFQRRAYTASDIDYLEFLAALDSYEKPLGS